MANICGGGGGVGANKKLDALKNLYIVSYCAPPLDPILCTPQPQYLALKFCPPPLSVHALNL